MLIPGSRRGRTGGRAPCAALCSGGAGPGAQARGAQVRGAQARGAQARGAQPGHLSGRQAQAAGC